MLEYPSLDGLKLAGSALECKAVHLAVMPTEEVKEPAYPLVLACSVVAPTASSFQLARELAPLKEPRRAYPRLLSAQDLLVQHMAERKEEKRRAKLLARGLAPDEHKEAVLQDVALGGQPRPAAPFSDAAAACYIKPMQPKAVVHVRHFPPALANEMYRLQLRVESRDDDVKDGKISLFCASVKALERKYDLSEAKAAVFFARKAGRGFEQLPAVESEHKDEDKDKDKDSGQRQRVALDFIPRNGAAEVAVFCKFAAPGPTSVREPPSLLLLLLLLLLLRAVLTPRARGPDGPAAVVRQPGGPAAELRAQDEDRRSGAADSRVPVLRVVHHHARALARAQRPPPPRQALAQVAVVAAAERARALARGAGQLVRSAADHPLHRAAQGGRPGVGPRAVGPGRASPRPSPPAAASARSR